MFVPISKTIDALDGGDVVGISNSRRRFSINTVNVASLTTFNDLSHRKTENLTLVERRQQTYVLLEGIYIDGPFE